MYWEGLWIKPRVVQAWVNWNFRDDEMRTPTQFDLTIGVLFMVKLFEPKSVLKWMWTNDSFKNRSFVIQFSAFCREIRSKCW